MPAKCIKLEKTVTIGAGLMTPGIEIAEVTRSQLLVNWQGEDKNKARLRLNAGVQVDVDLAFVPAELQAHLDAFTDGLLKIGQDAGKFPVGKIE